VQVDNDGKALGINDGIPWSDGSLLLATDQGLRAYAPAARKLYQANLPEPPHPATALVRDGLGRIWLLADKRLWLSESGARTPESFDRVPWVGRGEVSAIASDPQHADGVIAALGSRGVAIVRARQRP
jgi:ligand-binding sensor domain-containing protein